MEGSQDTIKTPDGFDILKEGFLEVQIAKLGDLEAEWNTLNAELDSIKQKDLSGEMTPVEKARWTEIVARGKQIFKEEEDVLEEAMTNLRTRRI